METIADEIFNILKGAGYSLRLFNSEGVKTLDAQEATRFYAFDQDLMITLRQKDGRVEVVVQAGAGYDIPANSELLATIQSVAHKHLGEYTVRKFDKQITPKDFSHQTVAEGFSKPFGSIKTSYVQSPNAKLIIKHSKGVNEEVRGARSHHIHSLFIENAQGERFSFPHKYMSGAKAMAMHINEGGTPYDEKGQAILDLCEEIASLNKFLKHVKTNGLVNESNQDIVETVKQQLQQYKSTINGLTTQRGYNSFSVQEKTEVSEENVDITNKFLYNTFTEEMDSILSKVSRIVSEKTDRESRNLAAIKAVYDVVDQGKNIGLAIDQNDPEWPDNEDPIKYSGSEGAEAKLASVLRYMALNAKDDEASNHFANLSGLVHELSPSHKQAVAKMVDYIVQSSTTGAAESVEETELTLDESVVLELRKKIG